MYRLLAYLLTVSVLCYYFILFNNENITGMFIIMHDLALTFSII